MKLKTWHNYSYSLDQIILLDNHWIAKALDLFWKEVMNKLTPEQKVIILFRVKWSDGSMVTIGKSLTLTNLDLKKMMNYIISLFHGKGDDYHTLTVSNFIISYHIIPSNIKDPIKTVIPEIVKDNNTSPNKFSRKSGYSRLPSTANFLKWGLPINKVLIYQHWVYTIIKEDYTFIVTVKADSNVIKLMSHGQLILEFTDIIEDVNKFTRYINDDVMYYHNNSLVLLTSNRSTRILKTIKKSIRAT